MPVFREHFRGLEEWKAEGLPITTPSNEAAKLYDAAITQWAGWYADDNLGGFKGTFKSMLKADPEFVLGWCLKISLDFFFSEKAIRTNTKFKEDLRTFEDIVSRAKNLTDREQKHVKAALKLAHFEMDAAILIWESILVDYPTDTHVLKLLTDVYFLTGKKAELRDTSARVVQYYSDKKNPLTGYVYGMDAFGLEENCLYDQAIKQANQALEITPYDAWAHHAIGHCYEMLGKTKEGIQHYELREKDWTPVDGLLSHNWWHYGVYHIERLEFEKASDIFQKHCLPISENDGNIFNIIDSTSFMYRLKLVDQDLSQDVWNRLHKVVGPHCGDHGGAFPDVHFFMDLMGTKRFNDAQQFIETLDREDPLYPLTKTILEAMYQHEKGNHEQAVDLLIPIKYKILQIGGSDAQRDVLSQLLVMSAVKSPNPSHRNLARNLLYERDQLKPISPLNNLMRQKLENYN